MKVLVACEESGVVREAFRKMGHDAWSCDLQPTAIPGQHYRGDVRDILADDWDMLIAHPTCRYLTNSGVVWLHRDKSRWQKLDEGAAFFRLFMEAEHIPKRVIENPIMHKYAIERIGGTKQSQVIQPWMFGHMEQKATCLWLYGLPDLVPTDNVKDAMMRLPNKDRQRIHYMSPGPEREKMRSRTFQGIADAMAEQWG